MIVFVLCCHLTKDLKRHASLVVIIFTVCIISGVHLVHYLVDLICMVFENLYIVHISTLTHYTQRFNDVLQNTVLLLMTAISRPPIKGCFAVLKNGNWVTMGTLGITLLVQIHTNKLWNCSMSISKGGSFAKGK